MGNGCSCIYSFLLWLHWGDVKRRTTWGRDKGLNRKVTGKERQPEEHLQVGGKTLGSPGLTCSPTKQCGGEDAPRTHSEKITGLMGTQSWLAWSKTLTELPMKFYQRHTKDFPFGMSSICSTENSLGDSDVLLWGVTIHDLSQWLLILKCHKRTLLQPFGFSWQTILSVTNYKQSLRKWEREMHS